MPNITLSSKVPAALYAQLQKEAFKRELPLSVVIREILEAHYAAPAKPLASILQQKELLPKSCFAHITKSKKEDIGGLTVYLNTEHQLCFYVESRATSRKDCYHFKIFSKEVWDNLKGITQEDLTYDMLCQVENLLIIDLNEPWSQYLNKTLLLKRVKQEFRKHSDFASVQSEFLDALEIFQVQPTFALQKLEKLWHRLHPRLAKIAQLCPS